MAEVFVSFFFTWSQFKQHIQQIYLFNSCDVNYVLPSLYRDSLLHFNAIKTWRWKEEEKSVHFPCKLVHQKSFISMENMPRLRLIKKKRWSYFFFLSSIGSNCILRGWIQSSRQKSAELHDNTSVLLNQQLFLK